MSLEHPLRILVLIPLISYFLNERVIQKDHNKTRTENEHLFGQIYEVFSPNMAKLKLQECKGIAAT